MMTIPEGTTSSELIGHRPVVLVVDFSRSLSDTDLPSHVPAVAKAANATRQLLDRTRQAGLPTIFTLGGKMWFTSGGNDLTIAERGRWFDTVGIREETSADASHHMGVASVLDRRDDEILVLKTQPSAFFGSPLSSYLVQLGADSLVMAGITTSGCFRSSVGDAFSYGYRILVPEECVADVDQADHASSLRVIGAKYANLEPLADVCELLSRLGK